MPGSRKIHKADSHPIVKPTANLSSLTHSPRQDTLKPRKVYEVPKKGTGFVKAATPNLWRKHA